MEALRELGKRFFPIGLGAMPLSIKGRPSESDALAVLRASFDAGVTFVDTADAYCMDDSETGHNERLIAKALKGYPNRASIVVATKGGCVRPAGEWRTDGRPDHLRQACHQSLRALEVERIFLYQFHAPDPKVRFEESVEELARLQREGKIAHIGLSNVTIHQLEAALSIVPIESVQNHCSVLASDDFSNGLVEICESRGITYIPYSPVGGGYGHRSLGNHPVLRAMGERHSCSPYAIALAWLLHKSPCTLPIPGASKILSATDSPTAARISLSSEEMLELNRLQGR